MKSKKNNRLNRQVVPNKYVFFETEINSSFDKWFLPEFSCTRHIIGSLLSCYHGLFGYPDFIQNLCCDLEVFVTARVRSTREGNVLTPVCVSVHTCRGGGGGAPHLRSGGRGVPHLRISGLGGGGYPIPGLAGVYPIPGLAGGGEYPIPGLDWADTPQPGTGYPPLDMGRGTPPPRDRSA